MSIYAGHESREKRISLRKEGGGGGAKKETSNDITS